ncbi:hypothetical protein EGW08_001777 [Elysia chlorotica]|uniref:ADAM10 endopeptidase n=1 Tax=Elysia chlorotica TaxID=188477 RepID=A0A433U9J3_ELYCH|nr:hypothetical protein EGW08_001777 [Elysia chlorotica]
MGATGWTQLALTAVCIGLLWIASGTDAAYLNDYILDYEPLHFEHAHLHAKHTRVRRDVDSAIRWNFKAYGRTFKLHLQPDSSVFAPDHTIELDGKGTAKPADLSFFYEGHLTDVPGSKAHMSVHEDHIWGQVAIPGVTTYYIEPAKHHLQGNNSFHTIIYPESRMNLDPYRHKRKNSGTCPTDLYDALKLRAQPVDTVRPARHRREAENPYLKYSANLNVGKQAYHANSRVRRAAGDLRNSQDKTCFMQLRADVLLYNNLLQKHGSSTNRVILSLFASHIKQLTEIYLSTTFQDGSNPPINGINFLLQRSTIMKNCQTYDTKYCEDTLDVSNYLDLTSEDNHDTFCLVHTFTYRDFVGGTLGLAWVAEPTSGNAGVCGRYGKIRDSNKGIVERSLNTGIVTLINYNQDVPSKVSQITLAHEVGHNFGAEHDMTDQCAPYGTSRSDANDGNYIMFPNAIPGTMINNRKFSVCSRASIARVLETVGDSQSDIRHNCFKASDQAFCGNNVVEEGEECDCGYLDDCTDQCCNGRNGQSTDCKLKSNTKCSPTEGPCCTTACQFKGSTDMCASETDCKESSMCVEYPFEDYKTFCNDHSAVCEQGDCEASVCRNIGWEECFKTSEDGVSEEEMCFISCSKSPNIYDKNYHPHQSLFLPNSSGAYCDNFKGFCDVFSKCRKVDAEGPFKQLTDIIFDPVTFKNIREWATDHWWAVLLMAVGVIVFMGVFVFVFSYNTPSQDPRKTRRDQQNAVAARRGRPGAGPRRADKRSAPYSVPIPMEEQRSRPRSGAGRSSGAANYGQDNLAYDHRYDGRDIMPSGNHLGGRDNYGYEGRGYESPPPYQSQKGQQFDRIHGQRY